MIAVADALGAYAVLQSSQEKKITDTVNSTNWTGYFVASDVQKPQAEVTGVSASWVVPTVASSSTTADTYSAVWIGLGGVDNEPFNDSSLIQCGTEQDFSWPGLATYYAWYEILPHSSVDIPSMKISAGDQIDASIKLVSGTTDEWTINITDITANRSFQTNVNYASSELTADWMVERPTTGTGRFSGNQQLSQLANFRSVTFTDCTATIGSTTGYLGSFSYGTVTMYSALPATDQLTSVSDLTPDSHSFTVTSLASD